MHYETLLKRSAAIAGLALFALGTPALRAQDADDPSGPRIERADNRAGELPDDRRRAMPVRSEFWLGIDCHPAAGPVAAQLNLPEGQGLLVEAVAPDSPAAKAGIKRFDVLLAADGKPLKEMGDLSGMVAAKKDAAIAIELLREGKKISLSATPAKRPAADERTTAGDDEREWRRWFERMEQGEPMRMRFFHPGMVLPPGSPLKPKFPDDLSITLHKQGNKPAEIEIKRGSESWKVTDEDLSKLPEDVRRHVEAYLGRAPLADVLKLHAEPFNIPVPPPGELGARANESVERRMEEMNRRLHELREELNDLRDRRRDRRQHTDGTDKPEAPKVEIDLQPKEGK